MIVIRMPVMNSLRFNNQCLHAFSKNWGWFFVWGIALLILGIITISYIIPATLISVILLGYLILISGIVIIIDALTFWWQKGSGFFIHLIMGILYFAVGIVLIKIPLEASMTLTLFLGLFYSIIGIFRILYSLSLRTPRWGWSLFNGIISLLLGIFILANWPATGLYIIGLFVGIDLIFCGWSYIMTSLAARSLIK